MKYVSIDIETGGLNRKCSLLEFGAVLEDMSETKPISELPSFHTYILNDKIIGEPYALAMHSTILKRISNEERPYNYTRTCDLEIAFFNFLTKNGYDGQMYSSIEVDGEFSKAGLDINVAGKNFAMFDKDWLQPIFNRELVRFHRRIIDPAILFFRKGIDKTLPGSDVCMERASMKGVVAHTAVEDARMVIELIREGLSLS